MQAFNQSQPYYLNVRISDEVAQLALWLINFYDVQMGFGLAQYLGLPDYYHNHDAVRFWVHIQIDLLP